MKQPVTLSEVLAPAKEFKRRVGKVQSIDGGIAYIVPTSSNRGFNVPVAGSVKQGDVLEFEYSGNIRRVIGPANTSDSGLSPSPSSGNFAITNVTGSDFGSGGTVNGELDVTGGIKVGSASDYISIDQNGNLRLIGSSTSWDDMQFGATATRQGANSKPDFDETNVGYLFPQNDTTEKLFISAQLRHQWKEGSTIYPHVHWVQEANQTPVWKIDYKWYNNGNTVPAGWTTYSMSTKEFIYTSGSMGQISSNSTGISGTGMNISSILLMKLYRDDNAYTGDARMVSFDIHIEIDSLGSDEEYEKASDITAWGMPYIP